MASHCSTLQNQKSRIQFRSCYYVLLPSNIVNALGLLECLVIMLFWNPSFHNFNFMSSAFTCSDAQLGVYKNIVCSSPSRKGSNPSYWKFCPKLCFPAKGRAVLKPGMTWRNDDSSLLQLISMVVQCALTNWWFLIQIFIVYLCLSQSIIILSKIIVYNCYPQCIKTMHN